MAITEQEPEGEPFNSSEHPHLRVVRADTVLGETVSISPVEEPAQVLRPVEPFEDFRNTLHGLIRGGEYEQKSIEDLLQIRGDIQEVREALTTRYAELARLEATLQQEMTWTNGYLIDLNKAIDQKQKDQLT